MPRGAKARGLDRSSPLPLWAQLEADLRRRLRAGAFDDRFPSEHELVADYGVSRHTVRDALRRLRDDGVLESERGRGTWVSRQRIEQPLGAIYSLFRSVEAMGVEQRSKVLALKPCTNDPVAARLQRDVGTELIYLERVRLAAGVPLALDRAWLPRSIAGPLLDADFTHSGLYDELARLTGIRPTGGTERITAIAPSATLRKTLKIPSGIAAFEVHRLGCLRDRPVEWRETLIRADRFSVVAHWSTQEGYRMDVSGA